MAIYRQTVSQLRDIDLVEKRFRPLLKKAARRIEQMALKYMETFDVRAIELTALETAFTESQIEAHLRAVKRVRQQIPKSLSLEVSPSLLRSVTDDELALLEARYSAATLRVFQNLTTRLTSGVRQALRDAVESQVTPRAAVRSFFASEGLTAENFHFYETLLRTQTQLVYGSARWEEYQRPEIDEILWGYEYLTVGDDRVRENHAAMDGVRLPKDDSFWRLAFPPNGYNCRCQAVPLFAKERVKRPRQNGIPDEGFGFNPGEIQLTS